MVRIGRWSEASIGVAWVVDGGSREHSVKNLFWPRARGECRGASGFARHG